MEKPFNSIEAIRFGFLAVFANVQVFVVAAVISTICVFIPHFIAHHSGWFIGTIFNLMVFLLQTFFTIGFLKMALAVVDRRPAVLADLWSGGPLFANFVVGAAIFWIVVSIGFFFLIIPGIYLVARLLFWSFLAVDRNQDAPAALQGSWELTRPCVVDMLIFIALLFVVNLVGLACIGVGVLVTMPASYLATAFVYRALLTRGGGAFQAV